MKKQIISSALALVMTFGAAAILPETAGVAVTASAATTSDGFVMETDKDGDKYVAGYKGKGGDITIPKEATYIGDKAFKGNNNITSVTIPAGTLDLGGIGESAFEGCSKLEKVTVEGECMEIRESAFEGCGALKEVIIKGNIDYGIRKGAFFKCYKLESVTFGGNIGKYDAKKQTYIGIHDNAFACCASLKEVKFLKKDASLGGVGKWSFDGCISLKSINFPSDTGGFGSSAFSNCFELEQVNIPKSADMMYAAFGYKRGKDGNLVLAGGKDDKNFKVHYYDKDGKEHNEVRDQKVITLTVEKGSAAEKWAKDNGVKYTYPKSGNGTSADKLAAPEKLKASAGKDKLTLSWAAVDGADAYQVYMYNAKTKKYEKYKTVTGAKCTVSGLKSKTKYQFKVAALKKVNGKYSEGTASKAVSASTK